MKTSKYTGNSRKYHHFGTCLKSVSNHFGMVVYDVNHQEMMFKVIGIANKLQKH